MTDTQKPHIFCWYGNADFVIFEMFQTWKRAFAEKYPEGECVSLDAETEHLSEALQRAFAAQSLFSTAKFVMVKDPWAKPWREHDAAMTSLLHGSSRDVVSVLWQRGFPDKKGELWNTLSALAKEGRAKIRPYVVEGSKEARWLRDAEIIKLVPWARARLAKRGATINPRALEQLVSSSGSDLFQLANDIEKLALAARGVTIDEALVRELVPLAFEEDLFAFLDAIGHKQWHDVQRILEEQFAAGVELPHLLGMLVHHLHDLRRAHAFLAEKPTMREGELEEALGVHPFVAKKLLWEARSLDVPTIDRISNGLLELDALLKRSAGDPAVLATLVFSELAV